MELSTTEKIRIILKRRGMTLADLARSTGQKPQNLSNKMSRNNFSEMELCAIAAALDCSCRIVFSFNDTDDVI